MIDKNSKQFCLDPVIMLHRIKLLAYFNPTNVTKTEGHNFVINVPRISEYTGSRASFPKTAPPYQRVMGIRVWTHCFQTAFSYFCTAG